MAEPKAELKTGIQAVIDKLKKTKKRPEDWVFVPRRKKFEKCPILLEDGASVLISDGNGGFKSKTTRRPVKIVVSKVRAIDKAGNLIGGYRPQAIGEGPDGWTAEEVLKDLIELSLNPACEVVPYEAREMGKEAKDAEMNLIEERSRRQLAEDKLRELEDEGAKDKARIRELEKLVEDATKPKGKA